MSGPADWRPAASPAALRARAALLARLRGFLHERGYLEVETPLLSRAGSPEPHVDSVHVPRAFADGAPGWLVTSPEFHLKRLLAAGLGDVYSLARVFRGGEDGALHNVEFTLLEWYRVGADLAALMDEIEALLAALLPPALLPQPPERLSYREAFLRHAGLDPFTASAGELADAAGAAPGGRAERLDYLAATAVYPALGAGRISLVYDFPADQASFARVRPGPPAVAERVEAVVGGVELVNGFAELADAAEQRARLARDAALRRAAGRPVPARDERFLAALEAGLPACAGAALGFDRLAMLALGARTLSAVSAFPAARA